MLDKELTIETMDAALGDSAEVLFDEVIEADHPFVSALWLSHKLPTNMDSPHCLPAQLKEIWKTGTDFESRMEDAIRSVEVQDDIERTIEVLCTACCEALYNAVEHSEFCEDGPASVVLKHSNTGIGAVYAQAHSGFDTMSLPEGEVLPETSRESCGGSGGYRLNVPEISVNYIHEESRFLTLILLQFD